MSLRGFEKGLTVEAQRIVKPNEILFEGKQIPLQQLVAEGFKKNYLQLDEAKKFVDPYLRWQLVRCAGIPLDPKKPNQRVTTRTGVDGYFYGQVSTCAELEQAILAYGEQIWGYINIPKRFTKKEKDELKNTIMGTGYTKEAVLYWYITLGSTLARLRARLAYSQEAQMFNTRNKAEMSGWMDFDTTSDGTYLQSYVLPIKHIETTALAFSPRNKDEKLWWATMQNIGIFGNPLVRASMHKLYR